MKKIFLIIFSLIFLLSSYVATAENEISLYINDIPLPCDVPPIIVNDRTLCPTRAIFTSFGASVLWDDKNKQVNIKTDDTDITLTVDKKIAIVNSKKVTLDSPPVIVSGRCLVPIRFISETLGCDVEWQQKDKSVRIKQKQASISNMKLTKNDDDYSEIQIKYNGKKEPNIFFLEYSNCIVMDFYAAKLDFNDGNSPVDNKILKEIRYAQHPGFARIVVECNDKYEYSISLKNKILTIKVGEIPDDEIDFDEDENTDNDNTDKDSVKDENNSKDDKDETDSDEKSEEEDKLSAIEFMATRDENNLLVILDAGHGGKDPGTIYTNEEGEIELQEKDINLYIANKVYSILKQKGINVKQTRNTDKFLELSEITDIANKHDADLFVSVHVNAIENNPDVSGMMVLYNGDATSGSYGIDSKTAATYVDKEIADIVDITDKGIVSRPGLWVLRKTAMPAILVECAFITNEYDRTLLSSKKSLNDFALGIAQGIEKSLETMKKNITEAKETVKTLGKSKINSSSKTTNSADKKISPSN